MVPARFSLQSGSPWARAKARVNSTLNRMIQPAVVALWVTKFRVTRSSSASTHSL
jgi:hypothetical protein